MGSGSSSFASQVQQASVADLQGVVASFSAEEREKLKVALEQVPVRKYRRRIKCGGQSFAPYGMRTDLPAEPVKVKDYTPWNGEGALPEKVDLRPYMSPVENQSQTNNCCANAVAGAFEYINRRHCLQTGDAPGDISRLFIYYVGRKKDMDDEAALFGAKRSKTAAPKDEGMSLGGAISAMQLVGSCLTSSWEFDLAKVNERPTDECFKEAKKYRVVDCERVPLDLDSMRDCLARGHPIVFGLMLTDQFFRPGPGGSIQTPGRDDQRAATHGLHAMLMVGYNDRQKVFIVRNSWGEHWGDRGYCFVGYDYIGSHNFNLLQMFAITALSNVDFTPDADDGEDFDIQDDPTPVVFESDEEPEEPDAEDDYDFSENFKGDVVIRQFFLDHGGVLNQPLFSICLSLFHRSEAGKHFDWLAADAWLADDSNHPDKIQWTPKDFDEVVTKFYKQSDAEKFPNLAFLWS